MPTAKDGLQGRRRLRARLKVMHSRPSQASPLDALLPNGTDVAEALFLPVASSACSTTHGQHNEARCRRGVPPSHQVLRDADGDCAPRSRRVFGGLTAFRHGVWRHILVATRWRGCLPYALARRITAPGRNLNELKAAAIGPEPVADPDGRSSSSGSGRSAISRGGMQLEEGRAAILSRLVGRQEPYFRHRSAPPGGPGLEPYRCSLDCGQRSRRLGGRNAPD